MTKSNFYKKCTCSRVSTFSKAIRNEVKWMADTHRLKWRREPNPSSSKQKREGDRVLSYRREKRSSDPSSGMKQRAGPLLLGRSTASCTEQSAKNAELTGLWVHYTEEKTVCSGRMRGNPLTDSTSWLHFFVRVCKVQCEGEERRASCSPAQSTMCVSLSLCQLCVLSPASLCLTPPSYVTDSPCHFG